MEDLWRIQNCGIEVAEISDIAEYKQLLKRFCVDEEQKNRRKLLYGETETGAPAAKGES